MAGSITSLPTSILSRRAALGPGPSGAPRLPSRVQTQATARANAAEDSQGQAARAAAHKRSFARALELPKRPTAEREAAVRELYREDATVIGPRFDAQGRDDLVARLARDGAFWRLKSVTPDHVVVDGNGLMAQVVAKRQLNLFGRWLGPEETTVAAHYVEFDGEGRIAWRREIYNNEEAFKSLFVKDVAVPMPPGGPSPAAGPGDPARAAAMEAAMRRGLSGQVLRWGDLQAAIEADYDPDMKFFDALMVEPSRAKFLEGLAGTDRDWVMVRVDTSKVFIQGDTAMCLVVFRARQREKDGGLGGQMTFVGASQMHFNQDLRIDWQRDYWDKWPSIATLIVDKVPWLAKVLKTEQVPRLPPGLPFLAATVDGNDIKFTPVPLEA